MVRQATIRRRFGVDSATIQQQLGDNLSDTPSVDTRKRA